MDKDTRAYTLFYTCMPTKITNTVESPFDTLFGGPQQWTVFYLSHVLETFTVIKRQFNKRILGKLSYNFFVKFHGKKI